MTAYTYRLWTMWWDHQLRPISVTHPVKGHTVPDDVPCVNVITTVEQPFQTFDTWQACQTGWRHARAGHWIPAEAVRAHLSAGLVYTLEGQCIDRVVGTDDVWVRDLPADPNVIVPDDVQDLVARALSHIRPVAEQGAA